MNIKYTATKATALLLVIMFAFSALALAGCGKDSSSKSEKTESQTSAISASPKSAKSTAGDAYTGDVKIPDNAVTGTITVKDYGEIEFALRPDIAPITVENFTKLAKSGFYNGLTFHRIMEGFMIQGGDPLGNGTGGNDEKIKGEFTANGVNNNLSHVRGVMSMARSQDFDSASSQFFIVQDDSTFLDGQYAGFGVVTKGMSVVDKIAKDAKPTDNNGTIPKDQQPVIEKIEIK